MQTCECDGVDSLHSSLVFSQEFSAWRAQHSWVVPFNQEEQNGNRQQGMSKCPHDSRNTLKIQVMALKQSNPSGLIRKKNEQQYKKLDCTLQMQYVSVMLLILYIPPLCFPRNFLHEGHLWVVSFNEEEQNGNRQQGMHPTTQRTPANIHAMTPGSDSVLVLIWHWQCGHIMSMGWGP